MKLALWTYEGPPHVGAMRVATAMRDVHYVLHAPQGDTYADLLFTMIDARKTGALRKRFCKWCVRWRARRHRPTRFPVQGCAVTSSDRPRSDFGIATI